MFLTRALVVFACVIFYQANAKGTNNFNNRPGKLQVMSRIDALLNYGRDAAEQRCDCNDTGCDCPEGYDACCRGAFCCGGDYPICCPEVCCSAEYPICCHGEFQCCSY